MVSDEEIASCVESLLRHHFHEHHPGPGGAAVPSFVSVDGVVRQLEAKLGLDLSHKAAFIRRHIDLLLLRNPPPPPPPPPPPSQKDHFALAPTPQFQPYPPHHPYHFPHLHAVAASASSSPYSHLPHHHEISFRYPSPFPGATPLPQQQQQQEAAAAAAVDPIPAPQAPAQKESAPTGVKRKGGAGGLTKVCGVSPELQAIVGQPTMARTEIVKQLWAYIRKNNLQDPNNKRKIVCNDELRLVFETDSTDMFKMNKLLAKHIIPLEPTKEPVRHSKKLKSTAAEIVSSVESRSDGYSVIISDALAKFFGTRERQMLQSEAFRRLWDYIKRNQLEDPTNATVILCDSRLQQLFGCETLSAVGVSAMLSEHLFEKSRQ